MKSYRSRRFRISIRPGAESRIPDGQSPRMPRKQKINLEKSWRRSILSARSAAVRLHRKRFAASIFRRSSVPSAGSGSSLKNGARVEGHNFGHSPVEAYNSGAAGMEVRAVNEGTAVGWYKVTMDSSEFKAKGKELENSFETLFKYQGSKDGAALFFRRDERLATWEYYFTPEAMAFSIDLVKEYAWGHACSAPSAKLKNLSPCKGSPGAKYAYLVQPSA